MDELIDGLTSITVASNYESSWTNTNYNASVALNNNNNTYLCYNNEEDIFMSTYNDETDLSNEINNGNNITNECQQKKQSVAIKRKNLIIWDWDDTIFPTYSFRTHQDRNDKEFMSKLNILVCLIEETFNKMIKMYGSENIIIITNASSNWINKCLNVDIVQKTFMQFQLLLKKHNIKTISASKPYITKKYPSNHYKWKQIAFAELFHQYFDNEDICAINAMNCITSVGDSLSEYKASDISSKYIQNRILNRIKFKSNPSINDMIFQFKNILTIIHKFKNNLADIELDYSSSSIITDSDSTCS